MLTGASCFHAKAEAPLRLGCQVSVSPGSLHPPRLAASNSARGSLFAQFRWHALAATSPTCVSWRPRRPGDETPMSPGFPAARIQRSSSDLQAA